MTGIASPLSTCPSVCYLYIIWFDLPLCSSVCPLVCRSVYPSLVCLNGALPSNCFRMPKKCIYSKRGKTQNYEKDALENAVKQSRKDGVKSCSSLVYRRERKQLSGQGRIVVGEKSCSSLVYRRAQWETVSVANKNYLWEMADHPVYRGKLSRL